jgi:hypothetical protein
VKRWLKWTLLATLLVGLFLLVAFFVFKKFSTVDENNLPKFIKVNVVDPELITSISKFRSGAGHSNPGWPETCRSMKHYLNTHDQTRKDSRTIDRFARPPVESAIDIYSPVDGRLYKSGTGEGDDQLNIRVEGHRGYNIRLEHVHLNPDVGGFNARVKAGQKIATIWKGQNFDVSVFYYYYRGDMLFSYFQVLPEDLFIAWQDQGLKKREDVIFTREYRDAHPLTCLNDRHGTPSFAGPDGKPTENWTEENFVYLSGHYEIFGKQENGLH